MSEPNAKRITPTDMAALPSAVWSAAIPVRFRHCDPAGIIFTPRYFDIIQEAVERFFGERLGIDYYDLLGARRIGLGYAHASCEFLSPSRMGDVLHVAVLIGRVGGASYDLHLPTFREGREVVRGRLVTVTTALDSGRPQPIPDDVRTALERYRESCGPVLSIL